MSERKKVKFAEGELSGEFSAAMEAGAGDGKASRFKAKHSLDSDEEDEPDNYNLMKEDDIEGNNIQTVFLLDAEPGTAALVYQLRLCDIC